MKYILSIIILILVNPNAYGCTCIGVASVSEAVLSSDVVLTGKIISEQYFIDSSQGIPMHLIKYVVEINQVFKGGITGKTVAIITGIGKGDCGYNFELNKPYIIYAEWENRYSSLGKEVSRYLSTNICTRTKFYDKTEALQIEKL